MTLLNTISNLAYAASRAVLLFVLDWITFSKCLVTQNHSNVTAAAPDAQLTEDSLFSCYTKTMKQVPIRGRGIRRIDSSSFSQRILSSPLSAIMLK